MKKLGYALALMLLLVPAIAYAQPPGCTWEGDPALYAGWNQNDGLPYHQPGPDTCTITAGGSISKLVWPYNASTVWLPAGCKATDTLCFEAVSQHGWAMTGVYGTHNSPFGALYICPSGGYWNQYVQITAPCSAHVGDIERIIGGCYYANNAIVCDPSCGDCHNPNLRPSTGKYHYQEDTLYVQVVAPPPSLSIVQDTLTLVQSGQTQAYVGFSLCNTNPCAPPTAVGYIITSKGHIPAAVGHPAPWTGSVSVNGGECVDVYAVLNAGTVAVCTWDTLRCVAWMGTKYDTCIQILHVVAPVSVPLFTVPVVTILVLALILAAAVFMRRRAVNRA